MKVPEKFTFLCKLDYTLGEYSQRSTFFYINRVSPNVVFIFISINVLRCIIITIV